MTELILGDCLEKMTDIPDGSVDMVLTDPPYGTVQCAWDSIIPFEPMWEHLKRIIKPNGAIVMTASQPFATMLIYSNIEMFKYEWIWDKVNLYTNYLNANIQPLRRHENIILFCKGKGVFNKQYRIGMPFDSKKVVSIEGSHCKVYGKQKTHRVINDGNHNPCSIIEFKGDVKKEKGLHPTQKPVKLMEYLILTYTNAGETVLDFTMGSGTTGVACIETGRDFIGIELDEVYFKIAQDRIKKAKSEPRLDFGGA